MLLQRVIVLLLLSLGFPVFAQLAPGQWVGDLWLMDSFPGSGSRRLTNDRSVILVDENDIVNKTITSLRKASSFSVSEMQDTNSIIWHGFGIGETVATWHNGAFYTAVCAVGYLSQSPDGEQIQSRYTRQDGSNFCRWFFARQDDEGEGDGWQYLAHYDTDSDIFASKVIPCDNDRFIFITYVREGIVANSDRTPILRLSVPNNDKKELRLNSCLEHGQDEVKAYMSDKEIYNLIFDSDVVMTDRYATLVSRTSGLFWVFSKETALLKKAGGIFKKIKANTLPGDGFEKAILCVQPEKDGSVLISAQDEDSLIENAEISKEFNVAFKSFKSEDEANEWLARRQEASKGSPYIEWYRLYPETGRVEKLPSPPEGGTIYRDGAKNDRWRPMPDGTVKMGIDLKLMFPTPEETEKEVDKNEAESETMVELTEDHDSQ